MLGLWITGCVGRRVSSPFPHLLKEHDVVSCCLNLSAPCISFRVNGLPVQGMLENFHTDGLLYPVVSFSAGVKWVYHRKLFIRWFSKTQWIYRLNIYIVLISFRIPQPLYYPKKQVSFSVWGNTWRVPILASTWLCSMLWGSAAKSQVKGRTMSKIYLWPWKWKTTPRPFWTNCTSCFYSKSSWHRQGNKKQKTQ